jgi:hypothetical protein
MLCKTSLFSQGMAPSCGHLPREFSGKAARFALSPDRKESLLMALIPLIDCYGLLDSDPKTLRASLKRAGISLTPHPTDARIKCLTTEQIELLAAMHARLLRPQPAVSPGVSVGADEQKPPSNADAPSDEAVSPSPPASQEDLSLFQKLSLLETRVAQLSDHLAELALVLLQERDRTFEHRIITLETVLAELGGRPRALPPLADQGTAGARSEPAVKPLPVRQLNPAEQRARSRMPPLIEYSVQGTYVIVSSQEGELSRVPDSSDWFEWLATLSSFRFVGQAGRFTA